MKGEKSGGGGVLISRADSDARSNVAHSHSNSDQHTTVCDFLSLSLSPHSFLSENKHEVSEVSSLSVEVL